ncbi:30S ribosomal protein S2 [Candidatus Uhrbacteria bacterium CG_4_9_14_3_um_filter_36_7]|uniref:Small ribosomal subunit protein uS2 n=1 Tax=Candidatus Uhrbacteria bacterium CG_4_9_14_3_um_filter_36_7 TaxID=1975033 RepID=A0A2M7XIC4_9BACT|nr:MAG: 30S ribosomal protein S2 [Candidatus Uhrbacteria bacterium CG_4_9_14_3_um_filter_36_7]
MSVTLPSLEEMLQAGVHFGHQTSRWHPKMEPYIFGERRDVHVIDLEKTLIQLEGALKYVQEVTSRGGIILFLGTKRQAQRIIKEQAELCGMPYVIERWLGGTLTNFDEIKRVLKQYVKLKDQQAKGELRKYTKKEQLLLSRKIEDLERKVGGIAFLEKTPDVIFIVDLRKEKTAYEESKQMRTKVVALCDTNVNPQEVDYPIPANDDGIKSIEMLTRLMAQAVLEGKKQIISIQKEETKHK